MSADSGCPGKGYFVHYKERSAPAVIKHLCVVGEAVSLSPLLGHREEIIEETGDKNPNTGVSGRNRLHVLQDTGMLSTLMEIREGCTEVQLSEWHSCL